MKNKPIFNAARRLAFALIPLLASMHGAGAQTDDTALASRLRSYDEVLLNAVHRGDRATWERMTTSDFSYIEAGQIAQRREILEGLKETGKKPLAIRKYSVQRIGDTAIVIFEAELQKQAVYTSARDARMRRVFQRDPASDRVTGFIRRMESSDMLFVRD